MLCEPVCAQVDTSRLSGDRDCAQPGEQHEQQTIAGWDPGAQLVGSSNAILGEFSYSFPCLWPLNGDAVGVLRRGKK